MRRFRLNVALLIVAAIALTAVAALLFMRGFWAQGTLAVVGVAVCVGMVWHLQSRLIRTMAGFVSGLEMNDPTMRILADGDAELRRMSESMNRISEIYRHNLRELETRKLYYDRILRIMTHEMRNGITPVASMAADMAEHPESYDEETLREVAGMMHGQVEGIRRFLDSYYTLTHLPEPELATVRATDYFRNLRRIADAELQRRGLDEGTVSYVVPEEMTLDIDPALMNQVMVNLLRNALDAVTEMRDGIDAPVHAVDAQTESIDVPAEGIDAHPDGFRPKVEVVLTVSDGHPCLTVSDKGPGMPEEVMANLFQPFFSTKKGGSGVGLSICRQIVRRHGGELAVRSRGGKGTDVVITL